MHIQATIQHHLSNPLLLGSTMSSYVHSRLSSSKSNKVFHWNRSSFIASRCASSSKSIFLGQVLPAKMRKTCILSMPWKLHALTPSPFIVVILWNIISLIDIIITVIHQVSPTFLNLYIAWKSKQTIYFYRIISRDTKRTDEIIRLFLVSQIRYFHYIFFWEFIRFWIFFRKYMRWDISTEETLKVVFTLNYSLLYLIPVYS